MRIAALAEQSACVRRYDGPVDLEVGGVEEDSRRVLDGDLYVAIAGTRLSGLDFVEAALARGAVAIACEEAGRSRVPAGVPVLVVDNGRVAASQLASVLSDHPQRALRVVGVTGTNGKTTTATLCRQILDASGRRTGLLGTVAYDLGAEVLASRETTPGGVRLVGYLAAMRKSGLTHLAMEVSSHALDQHRTAGIDFACAVLTQITRDHLDYHGSFEAYRDAKAKLFEGLSESATAVLPLSLECGRHMAERTRARVIGYGRDGEPARFATASREPSELSGGRSTASEQALRVHGQILEMTSTGTRLRVAFPDGAAVVRLPLPGLYNVDNALAAAAAAWALDVPTSQIVTALEHARGVPGRLEAVHAGQPFPVLVDYAHTDDALASVFGALRPLVPGKLIACFGCGGDRDTGKRALMGAVAREWADHVVLTSDNPRSEDPASILAQIASAFAPDDPVDVVIDRKDGIARALSLATGPDDLVLIAGKGHEDYQEFAGARRVPFDDRLVARALLGATPAREAAR